MLAARRINQYFGTHYDSDDIDAMSEADLEEAMAWIDASR